MDSAVFNAMKRREELREELGEVERFLKLYNKFKTSASPVQTALELHGVNIERDGEQTESGEPQVEEVTVAAPPRRGWTREMLRPQIRSTILAAGRPLTRTAILKALDERDIPVGGSDRSKNMGTILWRLNGDFVSLEGFGYWPRNEPYPPAGYDPDDLNSPEAIAHTLGGKPPLESP